MFDDFLKYFGEEIVKVDGNGDLVETFIENFGGKSFGDGLFRVFKSTELENWSSNIRAAYPEFQEEFKLFGYDWLGRCFGVWGEDESEETILIFEIGANDILQIPCTFAEFLNTEIPFHTEECLAKKAFQKWKKHSKVELQRERCAGYIVPLFLGGKDKIKNLEDSDMEVYWSILSQIK